MEPDLHIAFVGTSPPRRCGIATFTRDLASGMSAASARGKPLAIAVTDEGGEYEYPEGAPLGLIRSRRQFLYAANASRSVLSYSPGLT